VLIYGDDMILYVCDAVKNSWAKKQKMMKQFIEEAKVSE